MRSHDAEGPDRNPARRASAGSRGVWSWCLALTTMVGVISTIAVWGWPSLVISFVTTGVLAAAVAACDYDPTKPGALRRAVRITVVTALLVTAAVGLIAAFEIWALVIVVVLGAGSPPSRSFVRDRWRKNRGKHPDPPRNLPFPTTSQPVVLETAWADHLEDLESLDDQALCLAWRRSFLLLQAAASTRASMLVVQQRERFLDELDKRSPQGLAAWMASGARAAGDPFPYLTDRHRQAE